MKRKWQLISRCSKARRGYGKQKWNEIILGPKPFTLDEIKIVNARRLLDFKSVGINPNGNHAIEIVNHGPPILRSLTIGVRSKDGRLSGAVRVDVSHIGLGQRSLVEVDCYKNLMLPSDIEVYKLEDPKPEDREYFWEFRNKVFYGHD